MPWAARETPRAAPPADCDVCAQRIGKTRDHYLLDDQRVICVRCIQRPGYYDKLARIGTRAGIAQLLGLWP